MWIFRKKRKEVGQRIKGEVKRLNVGQKVKRYWKKMILVWEKYELSREREKIILM